MKDSAGRDVLGVLPLVGAAIPRPAPNERDALLSILFAKLKPGDRLVTEPTRTVWICSVERWQGYRVTQAGTTPDEAMAALVAYLDTHPDI